MLPRFPSSFLSLFWRKAVPSDADLEQRKRDLTRYAQQLLGLLQDTLSILQVWVHKSQNIRERSHSLLSAGGLGGFTLDEDQPPLTDIDHFLPAHNLQVYEETIPEEADEENGRVLTSHDCYDDVEGGAA